MLILGVKFCGGCNPIIDRIKLYRNIIEHLPQGVYFDKSGIMQPWDIGIMIAGCSKSCIDRPEVQKGASRWILIAGESVNGLAVKETGLVETVLAAIESLLNSLEMSVMANAK